MDFQKFGGLLGLYREKCRYFGRWARVFQADKTLKQVQGDENAHRHSELVSESQG